ncbi:BRO family protein [Clostridium baratii]|uniref:phage antirepressor n=1 Tax=Clostridium baratii TaxID=1561 RepID=UPI002900B5CE|nr:BRO family protein [Clostridium baratii]MDU1053326.1 BRO family protein [Clostridium baratii]
MNNQLQIFKNESFGVIKTIVKEGEPIFLANPLAEALNYSETSKMLKRLDDDEKIEIKSNEVATKLGVTFSELGLSKFSPKATFITESGLYNAILGSDKKEAKQFKKWVTSEVLPQIRKTGGYIPINDQMDDEEFMARALEVAHRTLKKKEELLKAKTEELEEKNRFMKQISASSNSILVRDVAHLATKQNIKIGEKRLWNKLREWGLIQKGSTKPMQRALEQGLFEKTEFVIQRNHGVETKYTTRVTGKGQIYIIQKLLKEVF